MLTSLLLGTENYLSCLLSELACDIFYSATKIIIYCWYAYKNTRSWDIWLTWNSRLIEKVWVVSSVRQSRWRTRSYKIHMALMLPYTGIAALLVCVIQVNHDSILIRDTMCRSSFILLRLKKTVYASLVSSMLQVFPCWYVLYIIKSTWMTMLTFMMQIYDFVGLSRCVIWHMYWFNSF